MKPNNDVTETLRCTGMGETVNKQFQKIIIPYFLSYKLEEQIRVVCCNVIDLVHNCWKLIKPNASN